MSDIKLFRLTKGLAPVELEGQSVALEKSLQTLLEDHLEVFLGVRFLATEYSTGRTHGGRIDTLGIDENDCPVIIEYKRATNENVINQGLYYLDWLLDHKGEFTLLVQKKLGPQAADKIEWSRPRLICIAGDFTKYDEYAVQQINRNIELLRYRKYGDELLLFELVNSVQADDIGSEATGTTPHKTAGQHLAAASPELRDLFAGLKAYLLSLGDDVQFVEMKHYFAFKRIRNFACVELRTKARAMMVYLKIDPDSIQLEPGFTRNMRGIGHFGTGDLEITIDSRADFERAKPLLLKSYEAS